MINSYDFDKTIYNGDATIDFYLYCLKNKKTIISLLPVQILGMVLYKLKIKEKEYFKEKFFSFLKKVPNIDLYVENFWKENKSKIKKWYLEQKESTDVIISASPEFLLQPIAKELNVNLIATLVDKKTGKFLSYNCYGKEKVKRYKQEYKNKKISKFYSDSLSDLPMMKIAKKAYIVKGNNIKEYKIK